MKKRISVVIVALTLCNFVLGGLKVEQNRADALYKAGEAAEFTVTVTDDATGKPVTAGMVTWRLDNFGDVKVAEGKADLAGGNPFKVKGTLNEPGFLRLTARHSTNSVTWGVGYDVRQIRQSEPRPADFDRYWAAEVARLAKEVPLEPRATRDAKLSNAHFDVYRVNFATFDRNRVYGFMSVPTDKIKAPFGVHVEVPGAGPGYVNCPCRAGWITLVMNVHMFEPEETYAKQKEKMDAVNAELAAKFGLPNRSSYCALAGIGESREAYHFHDVLLGINRAVDWVATRTDADPKRFVYTGSSQGGEFGLYLMYLNSHILRGRVAVAAGTGHYGYRQKRQNGWPGLIAGQAPEKRAAAEKWAAYFDGVNFAAGIRKPIRFIVGFADNTCPPADVYAAFNACPSTDKAIANAIGSPHSWFSNPIARDAERAYNEFLHHGDYPSRMIVTGSGRIYIMERDGSISWQRTGCGNVHRAFVRGDWVYWSNADVFRTNLKTGKTFPVYKPGVKEAVYGFDLTPEGHVVMAENATDDIVELDEEGKEILRFKGSSRNAAGKEMPAHHHYRMIRKTAKGTYLVCCSGANTVREYDGAGKLVWEQTAPALAFDCLRRANGNTLVSHLGAITEYTPDHRAVWTFRCSDAPELKLANLCGLQEMDDGALVVGTYANGAADRSRATAFEVTRDRKIRWRYDAADRSMMSIFRLER